MDVKPSYTQPETHTFLTEEHFGDPYEVGPRVYTFFVMVLSLTYILPLFFAKQMIEMQGCSFAFP